MTSVIDTFGVVLLANNHADSFFSKSKMSLPQWLILIYWWVKEYPVIKAAEEAGVCEASVISMVERGLQHQIDAAANLFRWTRISSPN